MSIALPGLFLLQAFEVHRAPMDRVVFVVFNLQFEFLDLRGHGFVLHAQGAGRFAEANIFTEFRTGTPAAALLHVLYY